MARMEIALKLIIPAMADAMANTIREIYVINGGSEKYSETAIQQNAKLEPHIIPIPACLDATPNASALLLYALSWAKQVFQTNQKRPAPNPNVNVATTIRV
ncbi:hypothetical protein GCM10027342_47130 [Photobacterium alginatilyticum]